MADLQVMYMRGIGRKMLELGAAAAALCVLCASPGAFAASGPGQLGAPTTTTTLPAIPKVSPAVTDGQDPQKLLSNAVELSSVGVDTSALMTAIAAINAKVEKDAVLAGQAGAAAARATARADAAQAAAGAATQSLSQMQGAVRSAVVFLYTQGPAPLAVNPNAGPSIAYAAVYADSALSPYGILATRQADIGARNSALHEVQVAEQEANRQARKQASALAAERSESSRLETELRSISLASASAVESDHVSLASQAGKELLAASALEFKSKAPLPAPLSTTPVALAWAFSELGKPYVWGATGPNTFDCSGLTQFVWHAAGVSIPRVAADQDAWTIPVPLSSLLPGDLVFYGKTDIHHVGIYIGDGLMINAPHTGDVVQVSSIWWSDLAGFGRVHAPGTPVPPHQPPTVAKPAPALVIPTAKPVPSQTKPPKGWKPKPGETTPILLGGPAQSGSDGTSQATTTTPPTTIPVTTTTVLGTATTLLPVPDPTTTVTTLPPPSLPEGP